MSQIILATVEDGVLKPDREIGLTPGTKVRLTMELCDDAVVQAGLACDELDHLCDESPIDARGTKLTRDELHVRR
ncbi:MAG: antitoxin family protein [Candidatus Nealsonbacteria bacterium]|nr:antitoxin family protein [Candidatus Nealsonbacteria bacterium]